MHMHYLGKIDETTGESSVGYWWTSREGDGPLWRAGRAHLVLRGRGRKRFCIDAAGERASDWGRRGNLGVNIEWRFALGKKQGHGWGWYFKWGTNASDTTPDIGLFAGRVAAVFLSFEHVIPYRWLERWKPSTRMTYAEALAHQEATGSRGVQLYSVERPGKPGRWETDYDTRVFGMRCGHDTLDDWYAEWDFWSKEHEWSRSQPWWTHQRFRLKHTLLGKTVTTQRTVTTGVCVVPMPEHNYPAVYDTTVYTHTYTRPLGRLRDLLLGARSHKSTVVTPGVPIPIPGKGENSWDCDDDHIHSTGGATVEDAVANMVRSALSTRQQYGGQHMNTQET